MGIDGIGGGGFKPPGSAGDIAPAGAKPAFEPVEGAASVADAAATDLERLDSGELSLDQYVENRVEKAVAHLAEALSPEQLAALREQLRDQIETDPVVTRLLARSSGVARG